MLELQKLVESCGVKLYDEEIVSENGKAIYRISIIKDGGVTLEDCERVSRILSPILDVEEPMSEKYTLEVSSPGLERKLSKPQHFALSVGELVKFSLHGDKDGRVGKLVAADEENVEFLVEGELVKTQVAQIKKARTFVQW